MLTSKQKPPRVGILPGDEYKSFSSGGIGGGSGGFGNDYDNDVNAGGGGNLGGFGDLNNINSSDGILNAFGSEITKYDIEISYQLLTTFNVDKRVTLNAYKHWIKNLLQLNWDDLRIKRSWNELDLQKSKYITIKEFKQGLGSTNNDVITFYSNLMSAQHIHPYKKSPNKSEWKILDGSGRVKLMRKFTPKYLRLFVKKYATSPPNKDQFAAFFNEYRKGCFNFLNAEYWKPVYAKDSAHSVIGNLWFKTLSIMSSVTVLLKSFHIVSYEYFILVVKMCQYQKYMAYTRYKEIIDCYIANFNIYDIDDSNDQGLIQWAQQSFVVIIKEANRPNTSLHIVNHFTDLLLGQIGAARKKKNNSNWSECTKLQIMLGLNVAIDCTEAKKKIKDIKSKEGGQELIAKLATIAQYIFTKPEHRANTQLISEAMNLLSRIDAMSTKMHDRVLKIMLTNQRKNYNRNFGRTKIIRHTNVTGGILSPHKASSHSSTHAITSPSSKIKPAYGADSPISSSTLPNMQNQQSSYKQKWKIGALGAKITANKIERGSGLSKKERIIDIDEYDKLQNPFEFTIEDLDILCGFRYADVNQDNSITFNDFQQSLVKVGLSNLNNREINKMWLVLNPTNNKKGVTLDKFRKILKKYPRVIHKWLCRIISCNHLGRQPLSNDLSSKQLKKILKDQKKLTWKDRIDALYCVARLFSRTTDNKKEFQQKFKSFLNRILEHLHDPHPLVIRASCITLTRIMIYKKGFVTKYSGKIITHLVKNFLKKDEIVRESSFGCFANLVLHVPDTKKFNTLQQLHGMVQTKNVTVRCFAWRIIAICLERIIGLKKSRPNSWWTIIENILKIGKKEKSKLVNKEAIRLLYVFERGDPKYYNYIDQYIAYFPKPNNIKSITEQIIKDIQGRMDEYLEEATAQADAMDVYSLISTEKDSDTGNMNMNMMGDDNKQGDHVSSNGGIGGGGPRDQGDILNAFNFVDDMVADDGINDKFINKGLGVKLILHNISIDIISESYDSFNISSNFDNTRILLASLKYLGINIQRGELTLLLSELKEFYMNDDDGIFSKEKYAFLVKHCYGSLSSAWKIYLQPKNDLLMNIDHNYQDLQQHPKNEFNTKISELITVKNSNFYLKCKLLNNIYNLFITPEVENDDLLFEEMMDKLNPILISELSSATSSILIQEICIFLSRLVQYHTARFESYGHEYYKILFNIIYTFGSGNITSILTHACYKTCLCISSMVQYLNLNSTTNMTETLINCLNINNNNNVHYKLLIYKCILLSILTNIPLIKDDQIKLEIILKIWTIIRDNILLNISSSSSNDISSICLNILGYITSADYLKTSIIIDDNIRNNAQLNDIRNNKTWNLVLKKDIEPISESEIYFNNIAINDYGWDNLNFYSNDFDERNIILKQWYDLEEKSNNHIAMASIKQLIKALNHAQYKAKKSQKKPNADNDNVVDKKDNQPQKQTTTTSNKKNDALSAMKARFLAQQRAQNAKQNY